MPDDPTDPPAFDLGGEWHLEAEPELVPEPPPTVSAPPVQAPAAAPARPEAGFGRPPPAAADPPPAPEQIIEAMLFIGGPPLTAEKACSAVRGLTPEAFSEIADGLGRKYRRQNRPYTIRTRPTALSWPSGRNTAI